MEMKIGKTEVVLRFLYGPFRQALYPERRRRHRPCRRSSLAAAVTAPVGPW